MNETVVPEFAMNIKPGDVILHPLTGRPITIVRSEQQDGSRRLLADLRRRLHWRQNRRLDIRAHSLVLLVSRKDQP